MCQSVGLTHFWRPFLESQAPDATVRQRVVESLESGKTVRKCR
jgi:hypothetical protein